MTTHDTPIEDRIDQEVHHLLDFMEQENNCTDDYKSMFTHLTKVLELRQKENDNAQTRHIKMLELAQQKEISETTQENKISELQQQRLIGETSHDIRLQELRQQKQINDDAHNIKLSELEQRNTITKEAWLTVGTHIAGLVILMNHERAHIIASKAFGLVKKII